MLTIIYNNFLLTINLQTKTTSAVKPSTSKDCWTCVNLSCISEVQAYSDKDSSSVFKYLTKKII